MKGLLADLKHAARLYRGTPGASAIAIIVVAVAMAFVGAFLSLYVDLALRSHPGLSDSNRLVTIGQSDGKTFEGLPFSLIERMSGDVASLNNAVGVLTITLDEQDVSEPTSVELVTQEFMRGLRPQLHLGRGFEPTEHDNEGEPVAIVSYRYWQEELGGREEALGQTIEIELRPMIFTIGPDGPRESEDDTRDFRIVGVMDRPMTGVMGNDVSIWLPFERTGALIARVPNPANFIAQMAMSAAIGRRSESATTESVLTEMQDLYADNPAENGLRNGLRLDAMGGLVRDINVQRDSERQLQLFLVASLLLAFVAAANVSLFLLARAPRRHRELGIRMSVGAPMKRLARQLATESGVLIVAAALGGLLISVWLTTFIRGLAFLRRAEWQNVTLLDWRVLSFVGAFLLVLTVLVSLAPILGLKRLGIATSSREVVARATPAQRVAGTVQISIAGALAGAAIAFGWYLASLTFGHPGYETDNRYAVQYSLSSIDDFQEFRRLMESQATELPRRRAAIEAIPGVMAAAFGRPVPGMGSTGFMEIPDPNDPTRRMRVGAGQIDSRYVDLLGLELVSGSTPSDNDTDVALVNQAFAQAYWGREDVVGEFVTMGAGPNAGPGAQVVGVLEDVSFDHPSASVAPILFLSQMRSLGVTAVIEAALTPADLHQELVRVADTDDLELRIGEVRPLSELRSEVLAADRARGLLTISTATLVVVLAGLGFYGTQRYLVTAGRREYAIRASLGAGPRALGRLVFVRGLLLSVPGLVLGSLLAFIAVSWLRDDFVSREISPATVTVAVTAGLVVLLLLASLGPAQQARRTQPAPLLREE
ncbi:MAG TPA: ABC transporter permease [Gammaproteobacteria bacterium]|nr:ABC transporter permease [Gammaproteobacteria bacterium]